jgi:hypothetical protein
MFAGNMCDVAGASYENDARSVPTDEEIVAATRVPDV